MADADFVTLGGEESEETQSEPEPNLLGSRRKSMCFVEIHTNGKKQSVVLNINRDITAAAERLRRDDVPVKVHQSMRKGGTLRASSPPPTSVISGLPDPIDSDEEDECPICLDIIEQSDYLTTSCMHNFHQSCLLSFLQYNNLYQCPFCKQSIVEVTPYNSKPLSKDKLLEMLYNSASDAKFDYDTTDTVKIDSDGKASANFVLQLVDTLGEPSKLDNYKVEAVAQCKAPGVHLKNNIVCEADCNGVIKFVDLQIEMPKNYNLESGLFLKIELSCDAEIDQLELLCDGKCVDAEFELEELGSPSQQNKCLSANNHNAVSSQPSSPMAQTIPIEAKNGNILSKKISTPPPPPAKSRAPTRKAASKKTECGCVIV